VEWEAQPGQLLFAGFEGTRVPRDLAQLIAAGRVGGVVLFARNVEDPAQLRALVDELHAGAPAEAPLCVCVDQEGGRVQRLRAPWTEWPALRRLGERDDLEATRAFARALARELADARIDLCFAPVVDVDTNPANPVIGERSFSSDPQRVARHGAAFVEALQAGGVAACAKHFPGHGDTSCDSHLELPRVACDLARLRAVELPPFRAAIAAGVASVMTAHVVLTGLDPDRPATLSPAAIGLLREELGFDGLVFSDDLEMRAVADHFAPRALVHAALAAGVDALLVCRSAELRDEALAALEALEDSRLEAALRRVRALKRRFAGGRAATGAGPPYAPHLALARRLAADAGPVGAS
jgi:beta-N-acetylhexosaminidase